jgi:hypothetical protein
MTPMVCAFPFDNKNDTSRLIYETTTFPDCKGFIGTLGPHFVDVRVDGPIAC